MLKFVRREKQRSIPSPSPPVPVDRRAEIHVHEIPKIVQVIRTLALLLPIRLQNSPGFIDLNRPQIPSRRHAPLVNGEMLEMPQKVIHLISRRLVHRIRLDPKLPLSQP